MMVEQVGSVGTKLCAWHGTGRVMLGWPAPTCFYAENKNSVTAEILLQQRWGIFLKIVPVAWNHYGQNLLMRAVWTLSKQHCSEAGNERRRRGQELWFMRPEARPWNICAAVRVLTFKWSSQWSSLKCCSCKIFSNAECLPCYLWHVTCAESLNFYLPAIQTCQTKTTET